METDGDDCAGSQGGNTPWKPKNEEERQAQLRRDLEEWGGGLLVLAVIALLIALVLYGR